MLGCSIANVVYNCSLCHRAPNAVQSGGERNLIGWRTESDRTADGIRQQNMMFRSAKVFIKHSYQRACG